MLRPRAGGDHRRAGGADRLSQGPPEAGEAPAVAVAAAQAVAREHGVACDEAVRIAGGSNVLVHLEPAPVVARVMTGTAVLHDDPERWLAREVAVGVFLAARTDLAVPPSDLLPPGPHERDGLWMTMWRFVSHDDHAPPPEPRDWLADLLAELRPSPALTERDIDSLRFELDALTPTVFESSLPAQALHGERFVDELLDAYGRPEADGLEPFLAAHALYDTVWRAYQARRGS